MHDRDGRYSFPLIVTSCDRRRINNPAFGSFTMIRHLQLTVGDVCGDATGLRVRVDDIDAYNRVHFSVVEDTEENWTMHGEMSREPFMHRFGRMYPPENRAA
jgi:hypothetical protein